jgi:hypothetical protein
MAGRAHEPVAELGEVGVENGVLAHAPDAAVRVQHRLQQGAARPIVHTDTQVR